MHFFTTQSLAIWEIFTQKWIQKNVFVNLENTLSDP